MKHSLMMKLIAVPALSLSSFAFAADQGPQDLVLSASQMDGVTAGYYSFRYFSFQGQSNTTNQTQALNVNFSPALGVQGLTAFSRQTVTSGGISQSNETVQLMR